MRSRAHGIATAAFSIMFFVGMQSAHADSCPPGNICETYYTNAPPQCAAPPVCPGFELNGSQGGDTARSFMAAGMMGEKAFANTPVPAGYESTLLGACQTNTAPGSSWPEHCDFGGFVNGLNTAFGHHWLKLTYPQTDQPSALSAQLTGLKRYGSPSIVPLYGHADHWGMLYELKINVTTGKVSGVKFFDGGRYGDVDGSFDGYIDGVVTASGTTWATTFYQVVTTIASTDGYYNNYLVSFDPPEGEARAAIREAQSARYELAAAPGVIPDKEEMSAQRAEDLVWDALFLADLDRDPFVWPVIERGVAGAAHKVEARTPAGKPWDYYLVPLLADDASAVALVQLSAIDGAFEQLWLPSRPMPFRGVDQAEAVERAREELMPGEILSGGELMWEPSLQDHRARSPFFPHYQFNVTSADGKARGGLTVSLASGAVRGTEASFERPAEHCF